MKHQGISIAHPGLRPVRELTAVKEQAAIANIIICVFNTEGPPSVTSETHDITLPQIAYIFVWITREVTVHLYRGERDRDVFFCELHKKMM
jgi:hypothetical protein